MATQMNPLHWKREYQVALFVAAIFGFSIGVYAGVRNVVPYTDLYLLRVCLWGVGGCVLGAAGGFLRQLLRDR
jgi:hypothetical protein